MNVGSWKGLGEPRAGSHTPRVHPSSSWALFCQPWPSTCRPQRHLRWAQRMLNSAPIKGPSRGRLPEPASAILGPAEDTIFSLSPSPSLLYFSSLSFLHFHYFSRFFYLTLHVFSSLGFFVCLSPPLCDCISLYISYQTNLTNTPTVTAPAPVLWGKGDAQAPALEEPWVCSAFFWFSPPLSAS